MSDDALMSLLAGGAPVALPAEERDARFHSEFARRFVSALRQEDLGQTEESHQAGIAQSIWEVHCELNRLGEEAYSHVWRMISAKDRAAIKKYVHLWLNPT